MKHFFFSFVLMSLWQAVLAQCTAPVITASGPTSLCSGGSVTLSAPTGNAWTQKADFSGLARDGATGFSIGSKGYMGTGIAAGNNYRKDFWEYNPATNSWTQKADFGGAARIWATGFSIDGKGYIGAGTDGSFKKDFWEYNPASNTWTRKADFAGTARYRATGFSINSKGYIGTGYDNTERRKKDFWEYNPASNTWKEKADFGGVARDGAAGFSIGSKGYIGTGYDGSRRKDFWEYNPASNTWVQKADFGGGGRQLAVGYCIGSKGYIGTGYDVNNSNTRDFWEYNPATNSWTRKADFGGTARGQATGFSIGNKGYIGIGNDNSYKKDLWEYDPGYSYAWKPGGQTTASISVSTAGNYTVTTTSASGCSATSAATVVAVNTPATPVVSVIQPTCSVATGTITVKTPIGSGITYSINGAVYQSSTTFSNVLPGSYKVTARSSGGCVSAGTAPVTLVSKSGSCITAPVTTGTASAPQQLAVSREASELSVYPNPSSGAFNVSLSHFSGPGLSLEIMDWNGRVIAVKTLTLDSKTPALTVPLDLGNKAPGMYWIRIVSATGVQTAKVLIQH
ncbi:MAG: T9SS type A sorting domain-containing protein [Williamsia sp.]|nr:T9SS type A sorting domain-containing protein [Williamsia sp.]